MKCSKYFGAKWRGFIKSESILAPKGASHFKTQNIRHDIYISFLFSSLLFSLSFLLIPPPHSHSLFLFIFYFSLLFLPYLSIHIYLPVCIQNYQKVFIKSSSLFGIIINQKLYEFQSVYFLAPFRNGRTKNFMAADQKV